MKRYSISLLIGAALALAGADAQAQQQQQQPRQQQPRQQQQQPRAQAQQAGAQQIDGVIVATKQVELHKRGKPTGQKHTVALIQTQTGDRVVVDLGRADKMRLKLDKDMRVQARGRLARVGDRPVVMAEQLRAGNKMARIDREARQMSRTFAGRVERTKQVQVKGKRMPHTVVLIRTTRGQQLAADLGPTARLEAQKIQLKQGDVVELQGRPVRVGDRVVLMATELESGGTRASIQRPSVFQRAARR